MSIDVVVVFQVNMVQDSPLINLDNYICLF